MKTKFENFINESESYGEIVQRLSKETPITYSDGYFRPWDIETVRKPYDHYIRATLANLYSKYLNKEGKLINIPGDSNEYSMMNYLNSHYTSFAKIVNYINEMIVSSASNGKLIATRQLVFKRDRSNWVEEMSNTIKLIDKFKEKIMIKNDNGLFDTIINAIKGTTDRGYESENDMLKFIKELYPTATDFEMGGNGNKDDMIKGIDIKFKLNGVEKTVQQKKCEFVDTGRLFYFVNGVNSMKSYSVDYLGFQDKKGQLYLFRNNSSIRIEEYEKGGKKYLIPFSLLVSKK
jgi:hypothetical protein